MAIEPRFRGLWQTSYGRIRIREDDWTYLLGVAAYAISEDGLTFTVGGTVYQRVFGAGLSLVGVWRSTTIDDGVAVREDWTFTDVSTYTVVWTFGNEVESVYYGIYSTAGTTLSTEEKRAWITNGIGGNISHHVPYGMNQDGTYVFASDDAITVTLAGVATAYTRVVSLDTVVQTPNQAL